MEAMSLDLSQAGSEREPGYWLALARGEGTSRLSPSAVLARMHGTMGRIAAMRIALAVTLLIAALGSSRVLAVPLTPFRYEAQAQRHCPADTVVWLDFRKGIYYSKGQKRYGQGFDGGYVCRNEARGSRYRRSLLGVR
jgi:hypothetical protein